jgi:hypothetical protein
MRTDANNGVLLKVSRDSCLALSKHLSIRQGRLKEALEDLFEDIQSCVKNEALDVRNVKKYLS